MTKGSGWIRVYKFSVYLSGFTSASTSRSCLYVGGIKEVPTYFRCLSPFPLMGQGALRSCDTEKPRCTSDAEEQFHLYTEGNARL